MAERNGRWFWQRYAGVYDVFMGRERHAYGALGAMIRTEIRPEDRVLELATGTGLVAQRVAGACQSYLATDYAEKMLAKAQKKEWPPTVSFAQADATALPFPEHSFDAVIISNALHIMPNPVLALENIRRVLCEGGKLIAPSFVRYGNAKESILEKPMRWLGFRSWSTWSPAEYTTFLQENGWHITRSEVIPAKLFDIAFVVAE